MALCSPNLYCIDRFTHMQREPERERERESVEAEAHRLCGMVAGKAASQGEME